MTTTYKPGDRLFESATHIDDERRASASVREWVVLSVVIDPLYLDTGGAPVQVVTLRAFTPRRALYRAEIAPFLDIDIKSGLWRRTREEAEALR